MGYIDFVLDVHNKTKRNYLERVSPDKAINATIAKKFAKEYWDGNRMYGYGGYKYDGRWKTVAEKMAKHYNLKSGDKILDIGCGKGFLLYEFTQVVPGISVCGIDISKYAIDNSKEEVRPFLKFGLAQNIEFDNNSFDLVYSLNTLHNLYVYDLKKAVQDIERISKSKKYIQVESYRNEDERINLLNWQLTCECFYKPNEWEWLFNEWGYTGDFGFIYFK